MREGPSFSPGVLVNLIGVIVLLLASSSTRIAGEGWQPWGGIPTGAAETVHESASDGANLIIAGQLGVVDDLAGNVAVWNGTAWSGLPGAGRSVRTVATAADGTIHIATTQEASLQSQVMRWDGSTWRQVGNDLPTLIKRLALSANGHIYASCFFPSSGTFNVLHWNGAGWLPMGSGTSGSIHTLVVGADGTLYVGGSFSSLGGVSAANVARWNGTGWSALGDGTNGYISCLEIGPDGALHAGGGFSTAGGVATGPVARWSGSLWQTATAVPLRGILTALAFTADGSLHAAGNPLIEDDPRSLTLARWNGFSWEAVADAPTWNIYGLTVIGSDLYAVGDIQRCGASATNRVARWDGVAWHAVGSGIGRGADDTVHAIVEGDAGAIHIGGSFTSVGGIASANVARWTGSSWSSLAGDLGQPRGERIYGLARDDAGMLWAAGEFRGVSTESDYSIARWNGDSWDFVYSAPDIVEELACDHEGGVWAAFTHSSLSSQLRRYHVDGLTVYPVSGSGIHAITVAPDGRVYVGGNFTAVDGVSATNIAVWYQGGWSALGTGVANGTSPTVISALAVAPNGDLFVGGDFSSAGGTSARNIARWDGSGWHALGSGLMGQAGALAVDRNGGVYAGGWFTAAGTVLANNAARWNGTVWTALGAGLDTGHAGTTLVYGACRDSLGRIHFGGTFNLADGLPSTKLATWIPGADVTAPRTHVLAHRRITNAVAITFTVSFDEPVSGLDLSDVTTTNGTASAPIDRGNHRAFDIVVTPTADGVVALTVTASAVIDDAGNASLGGTASVISDRTPPSVSIVQPTTAATWPTTAAMVALSGSAMDGTGVVRVDYDLVGGLNDSGEATGTTSWSFATGMLPEGTTTATITAHDEAGNSASAIIALVRDVTAPVITPTTMVLRGTVPAAVTSLRIDGSTGGTVIATINTGTRTWIATIPAPTVPTPLTIIASDGSRESQVTVTVHPLVVIPAGGG